MSDYSSEKKEKQEPETEPRPISLGKYCFSDEQKTWRSQRGISNFDNPFRQGAFDSSRDLLSSDLNENTLKDTNAELKFKFKLPCDDVLRTYPRAQFILRMQVNALELTDSVTMCLGISGEVTTEHNVSFDTSKIEKVLKNVDNSTRDISIRLANASSQLQVNNLEILIGTSPANADDDTNFSIIQNRRTQKKGNSVEPEFCSQNPTGTIECSSAPELMQIHQHFDEDQAKQKELEKHIRLHEKNELLRNLENADGPLDYKSYLEKIEFRVPLDKLYKIQASCHHTEGIDFCGLLLKIEDPKILKLNGEGEDKPWLVQVWKRGGQMVFEKTLEKPVCNWNITHDKFLFQEDPADPVVYLVSLAEEKSQSKGEHGAQRKSRKSEFGQKLANTMPKIYKFSLPQSQILEHCEGNTRFSKSNDNFEIPSEQLKMGAAALTRELQNQGQALNAAINALYSSDETFQRFISQGSDQNQKEETKAAERTVTETHEKYFIRRGPDKMIDYLNGVVVLAYRHKIFYFDAEKHLLPRQDKETVEKDVVVDESEFKSIEMPQNKKIYSLAEIGRIDSCMVLEDLHTRQLRFIHLKVTTNDAKGGQKEIQLIGLGLDAQTENSGKSPMVKFRSSAMFDQETNKWYHVAIALRRNGSVEFYSDFIYVGKYDESQCVDIEGAGAKFVFRCVPDPSQITSEMKTKKELVKHCKLHSTKLIWKNRIGANTMQLMDHDPHDDEWDQLLHMQFSPYVRLYSHMAMFSFFLIVSHRNMISVYNMSKTFENFDGDNPNHEGFDDYWDDTIKVSEDHVRKLMIKKRAKEHRMEPQHSTLTKRVTSHVLIASEVKQTKKNMKKPKANKKKQNVSMLSKFEIACLVGTNTVTYSSIQEDQSLAKNSYQLQPITKDTRLTLDQRVMQMMNDRSHGIGILLLTDDGPKNEKDFYRASSGCLMYRYPLKVGKLHKRTLQVQTLKMRHLYPLLRVNEKAARGYIDYGCNFTVTKANQSLFKKIRPGTDDQAEDFVRSNPYLKKMKYVRLLSITNQEKTKHFPIVKKRAVNSNQIEDIYAIKEIRSTFVLKNQVDMKKNKKKQTSSLNQEQIQEEFYTTYKEFDQNQDSYVQVNPNKIKVFDRNRQPTLTFENLNIRRAVQVHQRYIYAQIGSVSEVTVKREGTTEETELLPNTTFKEGFYILNVPDLLNGKVENYRVTRTTGGLCSLIEYNKYNERIAYMETYNKMVVIPLPHLNLVNFIGMGNKHDYLVWRENKGFFTALNRKGELTTWSNLSGKLLYTIKQDDALMGNKQCTESALQDYDVYRGDANDITYTRNFYKLGDCSISLLRTRVPIDGLSSEEVANLSSSFRNNQSLLQSQLESYNQSNASQSLFEMTHGDTRQILAQQGITVLNTTLEPATYHFKVMELRTLEDFGKEYTNQCRLRFHFFHKMILQSEQVENQRRESVMGKPAVFKKRRDGYKDDDDQFEWDQAQDSQQRLYLSQDTQKMMEVINNAFAIIYTRENVDQSVAVDIEDSERSNGDSGQLVQWNMKQKITDWPSNLSRLTSLPYMFSPNFTYQLDFSYKDRQILIRETATQKVYMNVPHDMLKTEWNELDDMSALKVVFARIKWIDEHHIRIATQSNLDCILEIVEEVDGVSRSHSQQTASQPGSCERLLGKNWVCDVRKKRKGRGSGESHRQLKLVSYCKIDNMFTDQEKQDSPHFYQQPFYLNPRDVIERLIRVNQNYKVSLQHAKTMDEQGDDLKQFILEQIHGIDYLQPWGNLQSDFAVEKTFTWLDWLIIEQGIKNEAFKMSERTHEQMLQLATTILPNGSGILHKLAQEPDSKFEHINQLATDLFALSKLQVQAFLENVDHEVTFEIPLLEDIEGKTPLDICLEVSDLLHQKEEVNESYFSKKFPSTHQLFCKPKKFYDEISKAKVNKQNGVDIFTQRNIALAGIIFDNIKDYGLLHSSQLVTDAVIKATRMGLPAAKAYLKSRMIEADHPMIKESYPPVKSRFRRELAIKDSNIKYGYRVAPVWGRVSDIDAEMFKRSRPREPTRFEIVDLPGLQEQSDLCKGREFIEALIECKDLEFFTIRTVQILVDHHYYYWYRINLHALVLPAFIQLVLFWVWSNLVLPVRLRELAMDALKTYSPTIDGEYDIELTGSYWADEFNFGHLDTFCRVTAFMLTLYLCIGDLYNLLMNIYDFNTHDQAPKFSISSLFFTTLHMIMLVKLIKANDEHIIESSFWSGQSWVTLFLWITIVFSYLPEISAFSWIVGLIQNSLISIVVFISVFIAGVTAFADAWNAISQGMYIEEWTEGNVKYEDIDITFKTNFEQWMDMWQISFKASLGDFPDDWGNPKYFHYYDWIVFFLACIFLIILMLNLLISIITMAQDNYTTNQTQTTYKERALMVRQKSYSLLRRLLMSIAAGDEVKEQNSQVLYIVYQGETETTLVDQTKTEQKATQQTLMHAQMLSMAANLATDGVYDPFIAAQQAAEGARAAQSPEHRTSVKAADQKAIEIKEVNEDSESALEEMSYEESKSDSDSEYDDGVVHANSSLYGSISTKKTQKQKSVRKTSFAAQFVVPRKGNHV